MSAAGMRWDKEGSRWVHDPDHDKLVALDERVTTMRKTQDSMSHDITVLLGESRDNHMVLMKAINNHCTDCTPSRRLDDQETRLRAHTKQLATMDGETKAVKRTAGIIATIISAVIGVLGYAWKMK